MVQGKKIILQIDLETFSSVELADSGVYKYVESPDFDVLLVGYAFGDEEVHVIDLTADGYPGPTDLDREFWQALTDPEVEKHAFNAAFERTCLTKYTGQEMPPEQWVDTMVRALTLGLPGSLAAVGEALDLPKDELKDKQGKALIQYFCKPCRPTRTNGERTRNLPEHDREKWRLFKEYNAQDVVAERAIAKRLDDIEKQYEPEHQLWCLDQEMNDRGIRLDVEMIEKIVEYDNRRSDELLKEAQELTGLENPNSVAQLKDWLNAQGVPFTSVTKETVAAALSLQYIPENVRRALEIRQALGKASVKKYAAMLNAVCEDGRLRGILQFYGANRSGRWAGRLVQVHNLAKNSLPDLDLARELAASGDFDTMQTLFGETSFVFSELVRTAFIASEGCRFVVSDFSAIEARVLAWLAGESWVLDAFQQGKDIYCETASMMYKVPVIKHGENGHLRAKGKVAVLACIAEGQKVLTDTGLVPIENVTTDMKLWDGVEWVTHGGIVCRGEKEVISYGGLEATEDHIVWAEIEGKNRTIRFGDAARSGARLTKSGAGREAIRVAEDHQPGTTLHEGLVAVHGSNGMHGMRQEVLDISQQHDAGEDQGMPELQPEESRPEMARPEIHSSETAMRESEGPAVQKLRGEGDPVRVPERNGGLSLHDRDERTPIQGAGDRQDQQRRKLCTGEPSMGDKKRAVPQHEKKQKKQVYDIINAGPRNRFTVSGVLVHNCGYQGGIGAMKAMDRGGSIPEEELQAVVDAWRSANPRIVKLWRDYEEAAKTAIRERRTVIRWIKTSERPAGDLESTPTKQCVAFSYHDGCLFVQLPGGRKICYQDAWVKLNPNTGRESIVYMGVNQETKRWGEAETYGGKLVENVTQAVARDCLAHAMLRVSAEGYHIVMHVHDEMIVDVPNEDTEAAAKITQIMSEAPDWAPGLPLRGETYETPFYKKD